jgi:hypothetical protein
MAGAVEISVEAYAKIVLHAAKTPSQGVGGLLLGGGGGGGSGSVKITDVLPVYHGNPVGPLFEVASGLVETHWEGDTVQVVGVYFAAEEVGTSESDVPRFLDALLNTASLFKAGEGVLIEVDGTLIDKQDKICTLLRKEGSGKTIAPLDVSVSKLNSIVDQLLADGKHLRLVDVEDYLDNAHLSPANSDLADSCSLLKK